MLSRTQSATQSTGPQGVTVQTAAPVRPPPSRPAGSEHTMSADRSQVEDFRLSSVRVNWQLKAILPVGFVLLAGLLLFTLATVSLRDPERHAVLIVAGAGAVAICAVLIVVLAYLIQRPMVELQEKMAQVSEGDLNVAVSFAQRNDEIGDLGRNFNHMMQQLRESREEIERLHRTQMSRAEHLATLGELATGLAHEIRNPLAGIAGVIEIVGRDLPATSPARAVVKDVRLEITRISRTLTDLLETARPRRPRGSPEQPQHHRRTRRDAGPPAGALKTNQDRTAEGARSARSRARQRSDSPGASESAPERSSGHGGDGHSAC